MIAMDLASLMEGCQQGRITPNPCALSAAAEIMQLASRRAFRNR